MTTTRTRLTREGTIRQIRWSLQMGQLETRYNSKAWKGFAEALTAAALAEEAGQWYRVQAVLRRVVQGTTSEMAIDYAFQAVHYIGYLDHVERIGA